MPHQQYTISELASEFAITTRTIRFYEEKGLLHPAREGQKRLYNSADRVRLELILRGKRIGLTLEESRDIIEMYSHGRNNAEQLHSLLAAVAQRRQQLLTQLQDIQNMLAELNDAQQRCELALNTIDKDPRT